MTGMNGDGFSGENAAVVILTAAGSGSRLGLGQPKALVELAGVPLVRHAADRLAASPFVAGCVVTAPAAHLTDMRRALNGLAVPAVVAEGGPTRQASVARGLAAIMHLPQPARTARIVLVHDAARPFAPPALFSAVVCAVGGGHQAVVPVVPVTDTLQRAASSSLGVRGQASAPVLAQGTVDRSELRAVQTPQGFDRLLLERAHAAAQDAAATDAAATDDAGLVEALGEAVWLIPGDEEAAKITTARDLALVEALLRSRASA